VKTPPSSPPFSRGEKGFSPLALRERAGGITIKPHTKKVSLVEMQKHKKLMASNTVLVSINGTLGNVAFYNNEKVVLGKSACYFNLSTFVEKNI
jgi:type I restriction enzyme S subunit